MTELNLSQLIPKTKPMGENVIFEISFIGNIKTALGKQKIRFQNVEDIKQIKWATQLSSLYLRLYNKSTEEKNKQTIQSDINKLLIEYPNIQERLYYLSDDLRKIELFNPELNIIPFEIVRSGVYIPTDYAYSRDISSILNS